MANLMDNSADHLQDGILELPEREEQTRKAEEIKHNKYGPNSPE